MPRSPTHPPTPIDLCLVPNPHLFFVSHQDVEAVEDEEAQVVDEDWRASEPLEDAKMNETASVFLCFVSV